MKDEVYIIVTKGSIPTMKKNENEKKENMSKKTGAKGTGKKPIPEEKIKALFENQEQEDLYDELMHKNRNDLDERLKQLLLNNQNALNESINSTPKSEFENVNSDEEAEKLYADIGRRTLKYIHDKLAAFKDEQGIEYLSEMVSGTMKSIDEEGVFAFMELYSIEPESVFLTPDESEELLEVIRDLDFDEDDDDWDDDDDEEMYNDLMEGLSDLMESTEDMLCKIQGMRIVAKMDRYLNSDG